MLAFQDFKPKLVKSAGYFGKPAVFEPIDATLRSANEWLTENEVKVMNVETIVLPLYHRNLPTPGKLKQSFMPQGNYRDPLGWLQFVRVWYEVPE